MILFDTDVCIEILRGNHNVIFRRELTDEAVAVAFMTVAELYYGAEKSAKPAKNLTLIEEFLLTVNIIQTDLSILKKFSTLKNHLNQNRLMLPDADILIAATAITKCNLLVSGNIKHFTRFPNLNVEDWAH